MPWNGGLYTTKGALRAEFFDLLEEFQVLVIAFGIYFGHVGYVGDDEMLDEVVQGEVDGEMGLAGTLALPGMAGLFAGLEDGDADVVGPEAAFHEDLLDAAVVLDEEG